MQKWFLDNLPIAKKVISNFKSLDGLFDRFKDYETERYHDERNIIMFWCLPEIGNGIKSESIDRLARLEKTLDLFAVMKWSTTKLNSVKSRFTNKDYVQSLSVITEFEVAKYMVERFGIENIELYPELDTKGYSDICVEVNTKNLFFEVGNLGESLPQNKIQQILDTSAKYLGEKLTTICYFTLHIDTAELVFDNKGRIDVKASVKTLNYEIDMLALDKLAGFEGTLNIEDLTYVIANQKILRNINWNTPQDQELLDLITNNILVKNWLNSFDQNFFNSIKLIKFMACTRTSTILVEIHTIGFFPSKSAALEQESFLNHIVRNIEEQRKQIQLNASNIIVVQGFHWTFGFNYDLFSIGPLITRIRSYFSAIKEKNLSGVIVFSTKFEEALYINNKFATEKSRITKEDLNKLGLSTNRQFWQ